MGEPPVPNENDPGPYSTHRFPANAQPAYVDVFGLPLELKRPQAEEEKDQPDSFFRIDMATFMPSFSTADISIPVGNGDLKLEIRRNYNMQGKMRSLNFGHGWHSNLVSHARYPGERLSVIPTDPGPGHTSVLADVVTVTDEDGRDFNFVFAKTLGVVPDYEKAFSIDTSGGGTRYSLYAVGNQQRRVGCDQDLCLPRYDQRRIGLVQEVRYPLHIPGPGAGGGTLLLPAAESNGP